jgi:hypothetical protein
LTEGLALGLEKARRPRAGQCIAAGSACRAFEAGKQAEATSDRGQENELLPTWNGAEKNLEPAPLLPWPREAQTPQGRVI